MRENPDGVAGIFRAPPHGLDAIDPLRPALVLIADGVEKPGNIGAMIRTADAFGAAFVGASLATDLYNPNAIRASMGAIFRVPVCAGRSHDVLTWLLEQQFVIFAARVDGAIDYTRVDYRGKSALVLGSEASGLTDTWTGPAVTPISLPMLGIADSLNVSATAAVLCYESLRQRRV